MRKSKSVQFHSKERIAQDREMSKEEIARFLHDFQQMVHGNEGKRKLISLRVPEILLSQFKSKAQRDGTPYQTQIIRLMREWVRGSK